jgi:hypothetical protein
VSGSAARNGFIAHENPDGEQALFHIAIAETEAEVQPDAMANDLGWKTVMLVMVLGCKWDRAMSMPHLIAAQQVDKAIAALPLFNFLH